MSKKIYEVKLSRGRSNPKYSIFIRNVNELGAKSVDYGGIANVCLISHHMDVKTVENLCSYEMGSNRGDVTATEVTTRTINDRQSSHRIYREVIEKAFLPYNSYANIKIN